jgi:hypothetical protein
MSGMTGSTLRKGVCPSPRSAVPAFAWPKALFKTSFSSFPRRGSLNRRTIRTPAFAGVNGQRTGKARERRRSALQSLIQRASGGKRRPERRRSVRKPLKLAACAPKARARTAPFARRRQLC